MREAVHWFVVLAEESNVSAAADRVHVGQPTLSRMLGRLERDLGTQLFDRRGRRITLNDKGRVFLEHVRRADVSLAMAEQSVRDATAHSPRVVRLGFLHSFGTWLVPDLILRTRDADPRIRFELQQGPADPLVARLVAGDLDLAVVSPRPTAPGCVWRLLQRQHVRVAMPEGHPLSTARAVRMDELRDETFVSMGHGFGMRHLLDDACAAAGFEPQIALECQELDTVAGLVAAGVGIGLLPVEETAPRAGVVTVPLKGTSASREIGLIWRRGVALPAHVALVRDVARPLHRS